MDSNNYKNQVPSLTIPETKHFARQMVFPIIFALSFSHLINDMLQSLIPSIYPVFKSKFHLTFTQIGLITFTYQITASILQPFIGSYTDRKPQPYSLIIGMTFTIFGLLPAFIIFYFL